MRLRSHILVSTIAGIVLYPRQPRKAIMLALTGVVIDIDHYILYALRTDDWSPIGALRYDQRRNHPIRPGDTRPRYGSLRSVLHREIFILPLIWLLAICFPTLRPCAAGLSLHLLMDTTLPLQLDWRIWRRAHGCCEQCRVGGLKLVVYYVQPHQRSSWWSLNNRAAWCTHCARSTYRGCS